MAELKINDWLMLIREGYTPVPLPKSRKLPFDPVRYQVEHLEKQMQIKGLTLPEFSSGFPSSPFTPYSKNIYGSYTCEIEYQIRYASLMLYFLEQVAKVLEEECSKTHDCSTLLSMTQLGFLETAFQFVIPAAIRPYSDKGVILYLPESKSFVANWRPIIHDRDFRKEQLKKVLEVFNVLMNSYEPIKECVVKKFLSDYICLNEQLLELGEMGHMKVYTDFILHINRPKLMERFFVMLTASKKQPLWLTIAISKHITKFLMMQDGLYHLITAITDGPNCFGDFGFVQKLSQILVAVPRRADKRKYYSFLVSSFLDVMKTHPNAEDAAICFVVVLDLLPKEKSEEVFDTLLEPWEHLWYQIKSSEVHMRRNLYNQELDSSLKILSLYTKALPQQMPLPFFHRFKMLFNLWTLLYASYLEDKLPMNEGIEYNNAAEGIFNILRRILVDPSLGDIGYNADFLVHKIRQFHDSVLPELHYEKVLIEEITEGRNSSVIQDADQIHRVVDARQGSHCFKNLQIILVEPREEKDVFIRYERGLLGILQKMNGESKESLYLSVRAAIRCLECRGEVDSDNDSDDNSNHQESVECKEETAHHFEESRQKLNYFLSDLLSILSDTDNLSDDDLANLIDIPLAIMDVTTAKLNMRMNAVQLDIRGTQSDDDDLQLEKTIQNNIGLSLAILQCIVLCSKVDIAKFRKKLQRGPNILQAFLNTVLKLDEAVKEPYLKFQRTAHEIMEFLKIHGIELKEDEAVPSFVDESREVDDMSRNTNGTGIFSLSEIRAQLSDDLVPVRTHALIALTKGIRKKNKQLLDELTAYPDVMLEVMANVAHDDSYVYLAAINAMVQLAYWKQRFFDEMVDFFVNPAEKLRPLLETKMDNFREEEKEAYLLIQRVKISEAIARANKVLGEMAPSYFDRIVNPMLSLMLHTKDDQLRASVLSSLHDLIISCRGLNIHKHINEMLLATKLYTRATAATIVRRAALDLMHAIVKTYDIHILQEIPEHLSEIASMLHHLLNKDEDVIIKTRAMLCLQDINAQVEEGFLQFQKAHIRPVKLQVVN